LGIFLHLRKLAANGSVCNFDDTRVRIVSCLAEDKKTKGAATQTTALVVRYEGKRTTIYRSGQSVRNHARGNLAELLSKRAPDIPEIIRLPFGLNLAFIRVNLRNLRIQIFGEVFG